MSLLQQAVTSLLPRSWAEDIKQESLAWRAHCPSCNYETSIWELGGIRYKAKGSPKLGVKCKSCGQFGWHQFSKSS